MPFDVLSLCPRDRPSACTLTAERKAGGRHIGQTCTQRVVCAKAARCAGRRHRPDRLSDPGRRVGVRVRGRTGLELVVGPRAAGALALANPSAPVTAADEVIE